MEKATLAFEPTFDGICQMFDTIVDIMITAVVETPRVEQGLFQVSLQWWMKMVGVGPNLIYSKMQENERKVKAGWDKTHPFLLSLDQPLVCNHSVRFQQNAILQ